LASDAITSSGSSPARIATNTAVTAVIRAGVPRFEIAASEGGRNPSRAITRKMRLCPYRNAEEHRRQARSPPQPRPPSPRRLPERAQDQRQRLGALGEDLV
jgi:hypothetical protein